MTASPYSPGPLFDGATFDPAKDETRLKSQLERVKALMLDGKWRTLFEISHLLSYPESSVSARIRDMRKGKHGGFIVNRRRRIREFSGGTFEYQVLRGK